MIEVIPAKTLLVAVTKAVSLHYNQVLGDETGQFVFLSLSQALLKRSSTLSDVLLIETKVLIHIEHFRNGLG